MDESGASPKVRLDKWLWAARFFKTRALATDAVNGGKVHVNGGRVKPARTVHVGDRIEVTRGALNMTIDVRGVTDRRGPAREAEQLYVETEASRKAREHRAQERRLARQTRPAPVRRPDKRERRQIRKVTGKE